MIVAVLRLEDRKEAGLLRQTRHTNGVLRFRAPAEGARDEDVQVAGPVQLHGALHLVLEVVKIGNRRGGDVGDFVRHGDAREVLSLPEHVARALRPTASVVAVRAAGGVAPER